MQRSAPIDIQQLLNVIQEGERTSGPKITIFFSVPHVSDFAIIGKAELKSFIQEAERQLSALPAPAHDLSAIRTELNAILDDPSIWQHRSNSYAIFATSKFAQVHALPIELPRGVWVGNRFHLSPLVPLFALPDHFLVLEVSLGTPRLLRVHPTFATEIELEEVSEYVLAHDNEEPITNRVFHTSRLSKSSGDKGIVVPHGSQQDEVWREEDRYLRTLAASVDKRLKGERASLVICGTPDLAHRFERLIQYSPVLHSHKHLKLAEHTDSIDVLWRECIDVTHENTQPNPANALTEYEAHLAHGLGLTDANKIVELARGGGIESLIIEQPTETLPKPQNADLIDAALSGTLLHHGKVVGVEKLPSSANGNGMVAVLRPGWRELVST